MQNHKAIHQKKFECKTCGKCFGKGYNLKRHQQVHDVSKERVQNVKTRLKNTIIKYCSRLVHRLVGTCFHGHSTACLL